jgi:hypothetical protein
MSLTGCIPKEWSYQCLQSGYGDVLKVVNYHYTTEMSILVRNRLQESYLYYGLPRIDVGVGTITVQTHVPFDLELDHKCLLQDGTIHYFGLNCQLHFEPFAMRLCPYEASIHQLHLLEASDSLQAESQKLLALWLRRHPVPRRL